MMDHRDTALVLGIKPDSGDAFWELRLRAERAAALCLDGKVRRVVCCGADTMRTGVSEAELLKRVLTERGVPESAILLEDASFITAENIQNAAKLTGNMSKIYLVTSDYHMARAKLLCRRAGFAPKGVRVKTPSGSLKRRRRIMELLGILDALCGWQDGIRARPKRVEAFKKAVAARLLGTRE